MSRKKRAAAGTSSLSPGRRGRRGRGAGALAMGLLALLLCAGEAAAQVTCEGPNQAIPSRGYECDVGLTGTGDLEMSHSDLDHTTTINGDHVIEAVYLGPTGRIDVDVSDSALATTGTTARGVYANHRGSGTGTPPVAIDVDLSNTAIRATGEGVYVTLNSYPGRDSPSGEVRVRVRGGSITSAYSALHVTSQAKEKIDIDLSGAAALETTGQIQHALYAYQNGGGDIEIDVEGGSIKTAGRLSYGIYANMRGVAKPKDDPSDPTEYESGDVRVSLRDLDIRTAGSNGVGVYVRQQTSGRGDIRLDVEGGSIRTTGNSARAIHALHSGATGDVVLRLDDVDISTGSVLEDGTTTGSSARAVYAYKSASAGTGDIDVELTGGSISTVGSFASGVHAEHRGKPGEGKSADVSVRLIGVDVKATSTGVHASLSGRQPYEADAPAGETADLSVSIRGGSIESSGNHGVYAYHFSGVGDAVVEVRDASVRISANWAHGVHGYRSFSSNEISGGSLFMTLENAVVETTGDASHGIYARHATSAGDSPLEPVSRVDLSRVSVTTTGDFSRGLYATGNGSGDVIVNFGSGRIRAEGVGALGLDAEQGLGSTGFISGTGSLEPYADDQGLGSIDFRIGAEARVESPFFIGAQGRLFNNGSPAGRLLVTNAGTIEARAVGVHAWAPRSSGSTFGEGTRTADDAARTEPMIHVASSGDITVGASVMDDFIRARIAGEDGTLSTGERAVLSAVTANDSDALEAALDALPAAYDDDWKAEARNLLRKRGWTPDLAQTRADAAADAILDLVPTGIRVLVLDHHAYARYVRYGDYDRALSRWWPPLTDEEQALFDEQTELSAVERAILEALLLGGDLEAALARLSSLYADYKDTVRALALRYNAGDVRVDVTGGTITAEGDGVYARYVIEHDRNGAIMVSVAEGASVTGGRNGLYVGGAGAGAGNSRAQSVSIDGEVRGGTGAGVYMKGGGRLTVGATGVVGATSGVAILSDGSGDLIATVAGRIEGDVRNAGGALMLTTTAGSVITGTVHDPVGPVVVPGSVGRILLAEGGEVTVPAAGRLTGVDGEALRSEAGDLSVSIAGMVEGDVRSLGGDLTAIISGVVEGDVEGLGAGDHAVTISAGGEVTGVIHLAASSVVVDGRVCAVLLDRGGVVTVGAAGVVKEVDGASIRAGGGTLRVNLTLNARRLPDVIAGAIVLEGGDPEIYVNGVKLSGAAEGVTGAEAPNGARDVSLRAGAGGSIELIERHAPRAGVYEALPGLLHRMESGRAREARTTAEGSPVWVRLSGTEGSRGARRSTSSAEYDFASTGLEAGLAVAFPWTSGLTGSLSLRHQRGAAETSLADGKGEIDLAGVGLGAGLSWRSGDGWYLRGEFSVMDYDADLTSRKWGRLRGEVGAGVRVLDVEVGRRLAPGERFALTPRAWLTRSVVSMEGFTDALGARVRLIEGDRLSGGFGAAAELVRGAAGGTLALRGSLDLETVLSGEKTSVEVSGERLHAEADGSRFLVGLGARWRKGRFTIGGEISSSGPGSDDKTLGARLSAEMRF